jgi:hypothetical protein
MENPGLTNSSRLKPSVNLFLSTRSMCLGTNRSGEDHLTEFIASALADSPAFRKAYLSATVFERFPGAVLTGIKTQVPYKEFGTPDMQLFLMDSNGNEFKVLVEHKIDSAEGAREIENDERHFSGQLDGYLQIPDIAALLYFRRSEKSPSAKVLDNPKYVRPETSSHFLWENLYEALKRSQADSYLITCLREGFEELGFLPPPKGFGDMYHPEKEERDRYRRAFFNLLAPVRELVRNLGWPVIKRDQQGNEMKCEGNIKSSAFRITVTGSQKEGRFTILFVPQPSVDDHLLEMKSIFEKAYAQEPAFRRVYELKGDRDAIKVPSLRLEFMSLTTIIQHTPIDMIADRLLSLVSPLIKAASRRYGW